VIVKAPEGRWCDYCKSQWGKVKTEWHPRAKTQAVVVCISETHRGEHNERAYCVDHRAELSTMPDGSIWPLADQMAEGKRLIADHRARKAKEAAEQAVANV
jgi:hypothetical protein